MGWKAERVEVLGDVVNGHPEMVESALPELEAILRDPEDVEALVEVIISLGLTWDPRAVELLLDLVDVGHPDDQVRLRLAQAMFKVNGQEPLQSRVIAVLVALSSDPVDDVRDWACFGLGQLDADTTQARDALAARLDDVHLDTRCEALVALARTGDARALAACAAALGGDSLPLLVILAAAELADPALLTALRALRRSWTGDDDEHVDTTDYAVARCEVDDEVLAATVAAQQQLVEDVNQRLDAAGLAYRAVVEGVYPRAVLTLFGPDNMPDPTFSAHRVWDHERPTSTDLGAESLFLTVCNHLGLQL